MRILYIGDDDAGSTSYHRAKALMRMGYEVNHINPRKDLPLGNLVGAISKRFAYYPFAPFLKRILSKHLAGKSYGLAWVNCAAEMGPSAYKLLKEKCGVIVHYQNDDPFGGRDGHKWDGYLKSLSMLDLAVVVREPNVEEAYAYGAKKVKRVYMSYDPIAHAPQVISGEDRRKWSSEVSFVGTWVPERGPLMAKLVEEGIPLSIWGCRWENAPEWPQIKHCWRGRDAYGDNYVKAIQCSKVSLGLLSKGNRDLHTQRSAEVPFIGGAVLCAERTAEHKEMYIEGEEALFWDTPEECTECCLQLLNDESLRQKMVQAAKTRVEASRLSNDAVMEDILKITENIL